MNPLHRCVLFTAVICLASGSSIGADDQNTANALRFIPDGAALYKAATEVSPKPGSDVLVLTDEEDYVFDADGKAIRTQYSLYKILTQKGADGWDSISLDWEPWHEDRPTIRARVITPDSTIHALDPKTVSDSPAHDDDEDVYGDSRVLRAPLPAIAPGSVVEEEEVSKETAPFFGSGVVVRTFFGRRVPVQHSRLVLDMPNSLAIRYALELLPEMKPLRTESNGRVRVEFDQGPMEPLDNAESYLPSEAPAFPAVTFATGTSWQSVAAGYSKIVDEKVAVKDVQQIVNGLIAGKTTPEKKIAAILQYLSREIRYTGVEFGDAAIIPSLPSETLKRKYGDCKDKATLAVTMLRAAGVPSYVALLNVGRREDVQKDLPGMGVFDHAIVYVPGTPDRWIDTTAEYARLGQLPGADQGRLALVARPETTSLERIPESASRDNRILEKRELYLAESGPARVVETSELDGVFESEYRSAYADTNDKDSRKKLKEYMENQYLAEKLSRMETSNSEDLSIPFRLILEATGAKRGFTDLDSAVAAIRLESLFYRLPGELQQAETEEPKAKDDDAAKERPKKPRTADYQMAEAFVYEWQYKIIPPVGFQPKPLPPNTKVQAGPALLTEEFSIEPDGSVRALLQFDTVKRRYSITEATELRNKVAQLRGQEAILIYFEPRAKALLDQGKIREAFQQGRDLIALHPKEAVHHLQRAKALLGAGMGQAARDEAREAVRLEPNSVLAQKTLAEILEYDLVGRQYRRGSDYAGAEEAFRAASKLEPDNKEVIGNLAILLEYNHDGERYGPGANLKQAVAEYQSLKDADLAKIGLKNNLAFAYFYAGDFAAARKYAEGLNPQLNSIIVAAQTALSGVEAGLAEARKRSASDADLQTVAKSAGDLLMRARYYPQAAELMVAGAAGSNASATIGLAAALRRTRRHEELQVENSPAGLMTKMFLVLLDPQLTTEKVNSIYSRNARKVIRNSDPNKRENPLNAGRVLRNALSRGGYPADVMLDVVLGALQTQPEGNDVSGYRVALTSLGAKKSNVFVVKEDGEYRILDSSEKPNAMGLEALERVQANDAAGARILLDWVRDDEHLSGGDDPLAGFAFPRIWTKGKDADIEHMRVAAASITVQSPETAQEGIPVLEMARAKASNDADRLNLALALLSGYSNLDAYDKLYALSLEVAQQFPESKRLFLDEEFGLRGLKRYAEADRLAQEMTKRLPDDLDPMRAEVYNAVERGDYVQAHELGRKMVIAGKAEAFDLNGIAWNALFTGKTQQADLDDATKSVQMTQNSTNALHTLGCVYAELGKTREAREVLIQAMNLLDLDVPDENYWYAFGRIAEQYGEKPIANADYNLVTQPKKPIEVPGSSFRLAQIRLSAMHAQTTQNQQ